MVVRLKTDNPGVWLLSSVNQWHKESGASICVVSGPSQLAIDQIGKFINPIPSDMLWLWVYRPPPQVFKVGGYFKIFPSIVCDNVGYCTSIENYDPNQAQSLAAFFNGSGGD